MSLNPVTGSISGTPVAAGNYSFEVGVADAPRPEHGSQSFHITVIPGGGATGGGGQGIKVQVAPSEVSLVSNQTQQFTAQVIGTNNTAVTWSASAGSIDPNGLYTAPQVNQLTNVTVTATSLADKMKHGDAAVTVDQANGQPLTITTNSLPDGQMGNMYDEVFTATGGKQPYTWSATGNVPPGITLNPSSGDFAGMPGAAGKFSFTVTVKDASGQAAQKDFTLNVVAGGGNFDGPAELPRFTVASSLADTPAPGAVVSVSAGGNLQAALNSALCGNTIALQAGATFTGAFTFPAKNCDDGHWIIVRTSAPDSALPLEGQRLSPCYAGVASLPNRPQYPCAHPQNVLAQVSGMAPIVFSSGANHYRLIGLEITRPQGKGPVVALVTADKNPADHLVFDRLWIHGTAQDETRRGFALSGTTNVAIVDSYLNDFHCTARRGSCTDSQALSGGSGNNATGPWKIENDFLEAAAENILLGGGQSTIVPTDITIRRNHFYKVPQWQKGTPGFVGGYSGDPFIVKNHFEIKNASRVLLEGNLFEYSWGGFTQRGRSIVIGPRNVYFQKTKQGNLCPVCEGTDITVRYNKISHVGGGVFVGTPLTDNLGAQAAGRVSIHDTVVDDIDAARYTGAGTLFLVMNAWPTHVLNNVSIRHVTGFPDPSHILLVVGNSRANAQMYALTFSDNLALVPQYPVWPYGMPQDCASSDMPAAELDACFTTYSFGTNVLISVPKTYPPDKWPAGNMFPATISSVGFVNFNGGNGGDYHLLPSSPYKGKAGDGRDPGADIDAVNTAIQGVE